MQTYNVGSPLVGRSGARYHSYFPQSSPATLASTSMSGIQSGDPLDAHCIVVFDSISSEQQRRKLAQSVLVLSETYPFLDVYCSAAIASMFRKKPEQIYVLQSEGHASHCETAAQVLNVVVGRNAMVVADESIIDLCTKACVLEGLNVVSTLALASGSADQFTLNG